MCPNTPYVSYTVNPPKQQMASLVRDAKWTVSYNQALNHLKLTPEQSEHFADAAQRMRTLAKKIEDTKFERRTKVLVSLRSESAPHQSSTKICRATLMNNKPCSARAQCGDFCKRHRLVN